MKNFSSVYISVFLFTSLSFGVFETKAQAFLNGSFEITTAPLACNYNLSNATFNSWMSNVNAYGGGQECDILRAGCYNPSMPDGTRGVGIAAATVDEIALALSAPLATGASYTISFWTYGELTFRALGNVEIGASTSNSAFGTSIYVSSTAPSAWTNHVFSFVAPNNATHITVRNVIDGIIHWNHVDAFSFVAVLPTELLSFQAEATPDNRVRLNWEEKTEKADEWLFVQRSVNATDWENVPQLAGAGKTSDDQAYQAMDLQPFSGLSYYRLVQTGMDGQVHHSEIQSVNLAEKSVQISLSPNPTDHLLNLKGDEAELAEISLFNGLGQHVNSLISLIREEEGSRVLDVSQLSPGIYILKTKTDSRRFYKQ